MKYIPLLFLSLLIIFSSFSYTTGENDNSQQIVQTHDAGWRKGSDKVSFQDYCSDLETDDVKLTLPKGFTPFDCSPQSINKYFEIASFMGPSFSGNPVGLISDDKDAVILYPIVIIHFSGMQSVGYIIESEIRSQFLDRNMDVTPYVKIIENNDSSKYSNAEKIALYELDLSPLPFMEKYPKCIGVYLKKKQHPGLLMKIFLTEDSYKDKDKYIQTVLDNIHYGEKNAYENMTGDYAWDTWWTDKDLKFPNWQPGFPEYVQEDHRKYWKSAIKKIAEAWREGKEFKHDWPDHGNDTIR